MRGAVSKATPPLVCRELILSGVFPLVVTMQHINLEAEMKLKRRSLLTSAGTATVASLGFPAIVRAQPRITWRMQSAWAKGVESQYHADLFAQKVTEQSDGRLTIKSLTAGSVVGGLDVFDAVNEGVIDASHAISSFWIGKEPTAPMFAAVPLGMDALQYTMWYYQSDGLDLWAEMYKKYNFGFVGACGLNTAEDFLWSHKPITSLSDFNGLKIRTVGYWGEIATNLGARVVTLPGGEIYGALERKILDAAEFANPAADYVSGFHQVCKYVHVPGIHQPTTISELIINKSAWEKLTPDLQRLVKEAAKTTTLESWGHCVIEDAKALKKFEEYGTKIIRLSPEFISSFKDIANKFYEKRRANDAFFNKVYSSQAAIRKSYQTWAKYMVPPVEF